jgi:dipeptidyl aminopeptidase/acylaminoacyl peptidase
MEPRSSAPLIPRELLFGNPDKAFVQLSPDGSRISFLAPVDGVLNVWVGPIDDLAQAKPVTKDTNRGIRFYTWAYSNDAVIYLQDNDGDENWHVYRVDLNNDEIIDLTPLEGVHANIQQVSHKCPGEILVGLNDRNPELHDLYRVDIRTGERRLIQENKDFAAFISDDDFNVRFAARMAPDGGIEYFELTASGAWEPSARLARVPLEDSLTTRPVDFDKTGKVLTMIDSRGRNTAALTALDLKTGEQTLVVENPRADIGNVLIHPTEKSVQAVAFTYERRQWQPLDEAIAADLAYLRSVADGDLASIRRTLDDQHWIVNYEIDDGPLRVYHFDRREREIRFLFTIREGLEDASLVKMHPVVIKSRDGLDLVSYYSLPWGSDADKAGRPDEPLPMVLFVHGGPWGRDEWGYDARHQWLANRGYAVLSVNFRGSTGFGKDFLNAGNREWGRKMHDDLIDAVGWAIEQGIADPERVAIAGGSYGGYATLAGLTFTPEIFACGVDIVGPSNLVTLLETMPPYWQPHLELFTKRVGDYRTEEGRAFLTKRSPLTYVEQIRRPLLIGQGANDPRVKQAESDQIVQAMQEKNIPVTYALYTDEGHGFARPENRMSFYAITEAFLAKNLGGRYEPIGDDFENSSLTVPIGAADVPGLSEALGEG